MDSTVLYALGQDGGTGDAPGPADPVALQHLPQQRPAAHPDLHAVRRRAGGRRCTRRRAPGSTSCWSRRTGRWPSRTPTPSSWPTSSWRKSPWAPLSRAGAAVTMDERPPGCRARRHGRRRHREPGRPLALAAACTTTPFAALGLDGAWRSFAFEVPAGGGGRRARSDAPGRHQGAVGHHAAQGRRRGRWSTSAARWRAGSAP